jgi:iron complex outermembrane receptor protein
MRGDAFDGVKFDQPYDFLLPRLGVTWSPRASTDVFASWAASAREPAFRDLYDAEGVGAVPLYRVVDVAAGIYQDPLIRPEHVQDFELGTRWHAARASASVNLFRMQFHDELVYAGQFDTDLGFPILGNAARSIHQGIELSGRTQVASGTRSSLVLDANVSMSDNHFVEYQEVYGTAPGDTVRYDGNAIGFFPAVIANVSARWAWHGLMLGGDVQSAGRIYLDNNEDRTASIAPRTILGASGGYRFGAPGGSAAQVDVVVTNLLDQEYETGGYMDYDAAGNLVPQFIPAAKRTALLQLRIDF